MDASLQPLSSLMQYYHDCVAAQLDWARAINVVDQKDTSILGLTLEEQQRLGKYSLLSFDSEEAQQLAKRAAVQGADGSLEMGALFLVGQLPGQKVMDDDEASETKRVCAPLLTTPVTIELDLKRGEVVARAQERELSINYGLVAELLGGELAEGMTTERLQGLSEIVPDFPIDDEEFHAFWRGFHALATDLPLDNRLPDRRGSRRTAKADSHGNGELTLCDFYLPKIPKEDQLRLLPAAALLLSKRKGPALTVLAELEEASTCDLSKTALPHVFPTVKPQNAPPLVENGLSAPSHLAPHPVESPALESSLAPQTLPLPRALTETQAAVVTSARTSPLTVVTGPPGTGKSYTITAIVLDALQSGQTVLVASQMDKAVSVVVDSVERLVGESAVAQSGGRVVQRELANKLKRLTGPQGEQVGELNLEQTHVAIAQAQETLDKLHERFTETIADERRWSELWQSQQRLEPICPLPVLELPASVFLKAARAAEKARQCSQGSWFWRWWGSRHLRKCRQWLSIPESWTPDFDELDELLEVQRARYERQKLEQRLRLEFPANQLWVEIQSVYQQRNEAALRAVRFASRRRLDKVLQDESRRTQLRQLATLLRRRRHDLKRELRAGLDPHVLLWGFPIWAATNRTLGEVLPPVAGLFDLVVIDEASQCDPATAAAALLRGKRAVIVGDPNQLRHVSFLSKAREHAAVARVRLSATMQQRYHYRRSLFDVAADAVPQKNFFMLREHFRSHPQIIEFSNREFYDNELRVMTARPSRQPQQAVEVLSVSGARRSESSVNEVEVEVVLQRLRHFMELPNSPPVSLGVVSPFRDHVDYLFERVMAEFTAEEVARHALVIGTAHALQGDEKDIVLLTTSIDSESHPASLRFLQSPNLLNVALTRARQRLEVVTSVNEDDVPPGLLRRFFEHAAQSWEGSDQRHKKQFSSADATIHSKCVEELSSRLAEHAYDLWPAFPAAGEQVELVITKGQRGLVVLTDEARLSSNDSSSPLELHYRLARAGWNVARVPHRTWERDWHACLVELERRLG